MNAGFETDSDDIVERIKDILEHDYPLSSDGGTLIRELVQNADDALATRMIFLTLEQGLSDAHNPLCG